ncbi:MULTISPECIES: SdpI family protein [unclassified Corynebacterium]|uniref:SdpI family protein n=1 Tax=unclassified Corynebacterium TaxID=2624378 RepID=UPI0029CA08A8|nr:MULTISPECIES: SdpI family protein [unclassified Corynebacterium]WPF66134.1 SdpI family protein [Corynebacterium sp. 22KM0430]WPF68627.1 SdpI family protein [Corynebacterium sp. 21KM1197]
MIFGVILLILGLILTVIGGLAWAAKLPGNGVVGIRVPEVRKSQELWTLAHRIAGPFWTLGGISLLFGACFAFIAQGWLWALPIFTILIALAAVGAGAGQAAHAVAAIDARRMIEAENGGPKPAVDMEALRRAARASDR